MNNEWLRGGEMTEGRNREAEGRREQSPVSIASHETAQ